jgi:glycyl-tRNA synthetase beta chain
LRRAALGVIRLVLENRIRLGLREHWHKAWIAVFGQLLGERFEHVIDAVYKLDSRLTPDTVDGLVNSLESGLRNEIRNDAAEWARELEARENDLLSFFHDRLKVYLRDTGARHDLIDAVLSPGIQNAEEASGADAPRPRSGSEAARVSADNDDLLIIVEKVRALQKLVESEDGVNLLAGYKRAANILTAEEKKGTRIAEKVSPDLFATDDERSLFETLQDVENLAALAISDEDFEGAMTRLATLRAPIDNFFDHVLVNDEDDRIRANRLALLERIRAATATVCDFSKISG